MIGVMTMWTARLARWRRSLRRSGQREHSTADPPKHPVELGRIFVHEGETTIALHQLCEMERRGK